MRLQNVVSLIGGEIKNQPAISQIASFSTSLNAVKRGDLFFAKDKSLVPQAIKRGAYAIVYEGWIQIQDEEIAWIKVENLENAVIKLLRFLLIQNQTKIFVVSKLALEYASLILHDKRAAILHDPFHLLQSFNNEEFLFATKEQVNALALDFEHPPAIETKIVQEFLFATSFIMRGRYFDRLQVAPLFFEHFKEILGFMEEYDLFVDFDNLKEFPHFKPHFIDSAFRPVEFGKSERVIITEPDCKLLQKEAKYLNKAAPWAKKIYVAFDCKLENFAIIDFAKLQAYLSKRSFTHALVQYFDITLLEKKREQKSLL